MAEVKWLNEQCSSCDSQMNSWDMRLTKTFKARNTCEKCICEIYGYSESEFRRTMERFYGIRPCQGI